MTLEPGRLVEFYQASLEHLGAICERSWFDRLQVVAEARAARVWNDSGELMETELHFPEPDTVAPRDASKEVFPGCPLTFRLAEAILPSPLTLERAVLSVARAQAPTPEVAGKLWQAQVPDAGFWKLAHVYRPVFHFSVLVLARCEIQAIDQHWSLHRLAIALSDGLPDDTLASEWDFAELVREQPSNLTWPRCSPKEISDWIEIGLGAGLTGELKVIQQRQQGHLRRELSRVDDYFAGYERELTERTARTQNETTRLKTQDRLAAARAEHARRRADQIQRHEIRVLPRIDALMLIAEPAWETSATQSRRGETQVETAHYVTRNRRWYWNQ